MAEYEVGKEFRVNTTSFGSQLGVSETATLSDGGWVVTWFGSGADDDTGIYMQRFDAAGEAIGSETRVNTTVEGTQATPSIAVLDDGGWVVTWEGAGEDDITGIFMQRYDADGNASGTETLVNSYTSGSQTSSTITALPDGGWIVTWSGEGSGDSDGIYMQRYSADGDAVGYQTQVNTASDSLQLGPSVTALADGGWVVTWYGLSAEDSSAWGVYMQHYDSSGNAVGEETLVNSYTTNSQQLPDIAALGDGGWVVTWYGEGDGDSAGVYMQRYDAEGNAVGEEALVNTYTSDTQRNPSVAALTNGGWVVAWQGGSAVDGLGISAQAYDSDGNPVGEVLQINSTLYDLQSEASVTALQDGGFAVTWKSSQGGSMNIYGATASLVATDDIALFEDIPHSFTSSEFDFSVADGRTLASITITALPESGSLTLNSQTVAVSDVIAAADLGDLVWTPGTNDNGEDLAFFKFAATDDLGDAINGKITFDVEAVNDAPTASDGGNLLDEDGSYTFAASDFAFNDAVEGDAFASITITRLPASGSLTFDGVEVETDQVIAASDLGKLVWTPGADANGMGLDTLEFKVTDGGGATSEEAYTFTFDVTAVADDPTASDDTITIAEDGSHTFSASDFGFVDVDGDTLASVTITELPGKGSLTLDGVAVIADQVIDAGDIGKLVWKPAENANGNDFASVGFKVTDSSGAVSKNAYTISFDVDAVNDAPTASNDTVTLDEDGSYTFSASDFGYSDVEGDALVSVTLTALPSSGSLTLEGVAVTANQVITADDLGKLVWTPEADANGAALDTLKFKVTDSGGATSKDAYTIAFDVTAVDDAPTAKNHTITLSEDTSFTFSEDVFDFDDADDDMLAYVNIAELPLNGSLTFDGVAVRADQTIEAALLHMLVFTPNADAHGEEIAQIAFRVTDSRGVTSEDSYAITFDVTPVNDAPVAVNDSGNMKADSKGVFDVLANDKDVDGDTLSLQSAHIASGKGKVTIGDDGSLTVAYTGKDMEKGDSTTITVNYTNTDGEYTSDGVLTVTVKGAGASDIDGTGKDDTLKGTGLGEKISGGKGDDVIKGRGGDDRILGGNGNDAIDGGDGSDTLIGGKGDDKLTGSAGQDTFVFFKNDGHDVIKDFHANGNNHDLIDVSAMDLSWKDIKHAATEKGDNLILDLAGDTEVKLKNVDLGDLDRDHFLF